MNVIHTTQFFAIYINVKNGVVAHRLRYGWKKNGRIYLGWKCILYHYSWQANSTRIPQHIVTLGPIWICTFTDFAQKPRPNIRYSNRHLHYRHGQVHKWFQSSITPVTTHKLPHMTREEKLNKGSIGFVFSTKVTWADYVGLKLKQFFQWSWISFLVLSSHLVCHITIFQTTAL